VRDIFVSARKDYYNSYFISFFGWIFMNKGKLNKTEKDVTEQDVTKKQLYCCL